MLKKFPSELSTIVFDWDGTLLDSFDACFFAYRKVFNEFQIRFSRRLFRKHYHPDWKLMYAGLGLPSSMWNEADQLWWKFYSEMTIPLNPGTADLMQRLARQGFQIGVLSGGQRRRVLTELSKNQILPFVKKLICSDDAMYQKPDSRLLHFALSELHGYKNKSIYIGDTVDDWKMGKNANVETMIVFSKYSETIVLKNLGLKEIISSLSSLTNLLFHETAQQNVNVRRG